MKLLDLASRTPLQHGRAHLDLREQTGAISWKTDRDGLVLRLTGQGGDVVLDLGPEAVGLLKQALNWAGDLRAPRLRACCPA